MEDSEMTYLTLLVLVVFLGCCCGKRLCKGFGLRGTPKYRPDPEAPAQSWTPHVGGAWNPRDVDHSQNTADQQINTAPYLTPLQDYVCERYLRDPVELHGLSVAQAQQEVLQALNTHSYPVFIVGKGLHSADKLPRIKSAVEQLLHDLRYGYEVLVNNSGRVRVTSRPHEASIIDM